ncbi:MAG: heme biosynthesis HemY N-terminal domain-containing protein [Hyphomicrobiaceae bacterium]|nr:heme biosynthesis HemY N-terminal domain-containing protein [Hyphomicrobiaceae bacterium]
MLRLIAFLAVIVAIASGLAWLADRPGNLVVNWEGYIVETSVFRAVVILAVVLGFVLFVWSILRQVWESPAVIGDLINRRRNKRGLEALSAGMIAIGAGDRSAATRYAIQARKSLPNEPLTHLLRAQAAQLSGDKTTSRRIFEAMLSAPETEQLGLRGLFLEAEKVGEREAAKNFAERAIKLNPKLSWPFEALFELQCRDSDWSGALETLMIGKRNGHIEKASGERRRAVLLTAQAQALEDNDPERALNLALEAHGLAPDLVPAAALAGRMLASRGNTPKATKIIQRAWQKQPHPDLATAYAYARLGDSPKDRLDRVRKLAQLNPYALESPIAVATAAIEAKDFDAARYALDPLLEGRLTQRVCTLMARIEGEQHGDKGRVREWLARAVNAPRDPVWTADGVVAEHWGPVSPVTGQLDAFRWRVPVESIDSRDGDLIARKLEELVALGAPVGAPSGMVEEAGSSSAAASAQRAPVTRRDDVATAEIVSDRPPLATAPQPAAVAGVAQPPPDAPSPPAGRGHAVPEVVQVAQAAAQSVPQRSEVAPAAAQPAQTMDQPVRKPVKLVGEILAETNPRQGPKPIGVAVASATDGEPGPAVEPAKPATAPAAAPAQAPAQQPSATSVVEVGDQVATRPVPAATIAALDDRRPQGRPDLGDSRIVLAPPSPDDPGPDAEVDEGRTARRNPYRMTT